jgi:8-oxo-dGTP pyrophosphatase MutT (NUDIX family)
MVPGLPRVYYTIVLLFVAERSIIIFLSIYLHAYIFNYSVLLFMFPLLFYSLRECVMRECLEEANIHPALSSRAVPVSAVMYNNIDEQSRLRRETIFCFDLELNEKFVPSPVDGEVESFELRDMDWVMAHLAQDITGTEGGEFKSNCNLVTIDFLIR